MAEQPTLLVNSKIVKSASLYKRLPFLQRLYSWPFFYVYPIWIYVYFFHYKFFFGSREWSFLSIIALVFSQILTALATKWSVEINAKFTCLPAETIYDADVIKIIAADHQGLSVITPLEFSLSDTKGKKPRISFFFQALKFIYNEESKEFKTVDFPCDLNKSASHFQNASGYQNDLQIEEAIFDYGENKFSIPIPSFFELFQEHAVAPFFVFQVFCVVLWCLDEYWYYPIFTLFMLVVFESTIVFQRVRTLGEFRSLSMSPFEIYVYRKSEWKTVPTTDLLPGDLVSVLRSEEDLGVPCDVVLLDGNCIVNEAMLSGESTPQLKESLFLRDSDAQFELDGADKNSVLFGGTKVLQVDYKNQNSRIQTPDGGALCLVLRTGFGTSQGGLVRTMVHSTEQVSANNFESYVFILFLLAFAILASGYVWIEGSKDARRSKTKILLDCILILTSVVPPELPMELSLSVNNSLVALSKFAIFCTEPFRIPYAGKIDVCCFDKTGTITGEQLVVDGVVGSFSSDGVKYETAPESLQDVSSLGIDAILTLASAHALVQLDDGTLVGDPMETAQIDSTGFAFDKTGKISVSKKNTNLKLQWAQNLSITTLRRFPFSSVLKKSSSLVKVDWGFHVANKRYLVGAKGAPESLREKFSSVPDWYDETYKSFSRRGGRVLALGCKWLDIENDMSLNAINSLDRDEIESNLIFQGFLVFSCPLKEDSKDAIKMLNESQHRCIMITGDNALTAAHVAAQVDITEKPCLILDINDEDKLEFLSIDETFRVECNPSSFEGLEKTQIINISADYDLCITGSALDRVADTAMWKEFLLHRIWVYARVNPSQKEYVLTEMKNYGYITLMCGDGTNDVGALKQSHVGVALLNGTKEDLEKINERFKIERMKATYDTQVKISKRFNQPIPPPPKILRDHMEMLKEKEKEKENDRVDRAVVVPSSSTSTTTVSAKPAKPIDPREQKVKEQAEAVTASINEFLLSMEAIEDEVPTIKFGDASVAAPFTSKLGTIQAVCNIIRQGRSTLVATIQMYKILALNSLISAYSMSVLYLEGIKFGDYQATIMGIMMGVCFMSISKAKPIEKLSRERPHSNILNAYVLLTVLLQFAVHVTALIFITLNVRKFEPPGEVDIEGEFKPSLLNTAMYLISLSQQISTFAINYQGHPFRESLRDNKMLYRGLFYVGLILALCATEASSTLNGFMKLVKMPTEFRTTLCITIVVDFYLAYLVERGLNKLLSQNQPKPIAARPPPQVEDVLDGKPVSETRPAAISGEIQGRNQTLISEKQVNSGSNATETEIGRKKLRQRAKKAAGAGSTVAQSTNPEDIE